MLIDELCEYILARVAFALGKFSNPNFLKSNEHILGEYTEITAEEMKDFDLNFENLIKNDEKYAPLRQISLICGENKLTEKLVYVCLVCLVEPSIEQVLKETFGLKPCLQLMEMIWESDAGNKVSLRKQYDCAKLILFPEKENSPYFRRAFTADDRLFDYIIDEKEMDSKIKNYAVFVEKEEKLQELFVREEHIPQIMEALIRPNVVQICGENGCGKKLLLLHAAKALGKCVIVANSEKIFENSALKTEILLRLKREVLLNDCILCLDGLGVNHYATPTAIAHSLTQELAEISSKVCLCTDFNYQFVPVFSDVVEVMGVPPYKRQESIKIWEGYAQKYGLSGANWLLLGEKYKLSPGQIKKVLESVKYKNFTSNITNEAEIASACHIVLPPAEGNIKAVKSTYTLDDLKIPSDQKDILKNLCAHVTERHKVYDIWNMESRYPYGKNVSALISGPPGTGKTMAAHVLSTMLSIPLYQVDLSQVVDKYIGETEKRLEEIFNIAERSNTILFFDEADSVFGKRSEVNEAKDKYANTQVSYILQRIEQFDGLVIMATNFKQNIDVAFLRRIRYVLEFNMPDADTRREIWLSTFAEETPLQNIDFDFLSTQFELSGGNIKNIALNAAFLAASEGDFIHMTHIVKSLREENRKIGRNMSRVDFGIYGNLL